MGGFSTGLLAATADACREAHDLILTEGWGTGTRAAQVDAERGLCLGAALAHTQGERCIVHPDTHWDAHAYAGYPESLCPMGNVVRFYAERLIDFDAIVASNGPNALWYWQDVCELERQVLDLLLSVEKHRDDLAPVR